MIKRIVKLTFQEEKTNDFLKVFEESKNKIRAVEGCQHMELLQSIDEENVFFTYSYWNNSEALENYRNSPLFKETWKQTKVLFSKRAEAWSVRTTDKPANKK